MCTFYPPGNNPGKGFTEEEKKNLISSGTARKVPRLGT